MTQYSLFRKSIVHSYLLEHGRKQLGSICCFVSQNRSPNNFIYIEELFIELIFAYCKSSVGVLQKNNMSMEIQNFLCNPPLKLPCLTWKAEPLRIFQGKDIASLLLFVFVFYFILIKNFLGLLRLLVVKSKFSPHVAL